MRTRVMSNTGAQEASPPAPIPARWKRILKRVLQVGFGLFLLKGMAWLALAWLAWKSA